MRPVRPGDRGPAVEDVQRRLLLLGYDLGPTGIDGVFLGKTREAVAAFQAKHALAEDALVGDATWATLVDATFSLGDRMLYLRVPHFHGHDVATLQEALSTLGFPCGEFDAIFGAFTERAVREFQRNIALAPDGIVGPETVRALGNLRHTWEGKDPTSHSAAQAGPARACAGLTQREVALVVSDRRAASVAGRVLNLALAGTPGSRLMVLEESVHVPDGALVLRLYADGTVLASPNVPVARLTGGPKDSFRLAAAISAGAGTCDRVVVELAEETVADERGEQRSAVAILDAICAALS